MMASYVVCVVVCIVHSVHSYNIRGTIQYGNNAASQVTVSNYINGQNWRSIQDLTLDRLVDAETLPTLTLANFNAIETLYLTNIALKHVPVFKNTTCKHIHITGNQIKSVPANAFRGPRPSILDLSNNKIQSMAARSINMGARYVRLRCNKLAKFSQSWFEDPGNILILGLDGNRFEYLQDRAFYQMTKLRALYLEYNQISRIGIEAFGSGIKYLTIHFNAIPQLSLDMFVRRDTRMVTLFLHHNQLSFLPEALVLQLKPRTTTLFGNPWQCQCLRDIERWLRELNSTRADMRSRRGEPVCVVPRNFGNLCIPVVDPELQETYARALSPVPECLAETCNDCNNDEILVDLT